MQEFNHVIEEVERSGRPFARDIFFTGEIVFTRTLRNEFSGKAEFDEKNLVILLDDGRYIQTYLYSE